MITYELRDTLVEYIFICLIILQNMCYYCGKGQKRKVREALQRM